MKAFLLAIMLAACSASSPSLPEATQKLADLRYAPPEDWIHHDVKEISRTVSRWVPKENSSKETISIFRTPIRDRAKIASLAQLEALLSQAQGELPSPAVGQPTMGRTKQNLQLLEVTADFVPTGLKVSYHRVHAMIFNGDVLVHVLYTARTPDPDLKMFRQIVDTIHRAEG